jgi:hypothetical protein
MRCQSAALLLPHVKPKLVAGAKGSSDIAENKQARAVSIVPDHPTAGPGRTGLSLKKQR